MNTHTFRIAVEKLLRNFPTKMSGKKLYIFQGKCAVSDLDVKFRNSCVIFNEKEENYIKKLKM